MKRKSLATPAAGVVLVLALVLALAAAGWDRYIVVRHPAPKGLSALIAASPPAGFGVKPANSHVVTTDSSPFATYKAAAKRSPSGTAAYSLSWSGTKQPSDSATILLSYLPSAADADKVQAQAQTQFLAADSYKAENYTRSSGALAVTGVPGAVGAAFVPTASAGASATVPLATVAFQTGRAEVLVLVGQSGPPATASRSAVELARAEYGRLQQALPGFRLGVTSVPATATAVYWAVVAGLIGLAVAIPLGVRRTRQRSVEARRRTAQHQHQLRGSKIARRQAARRR